MEQGFKAVTLSHKTAPLDIRETVSLSNEETGRLLASIQEYYSDITDLLVVSTCNRTEIYYTYDHDLTSQIIKLIGIIKGIGEIPYANEHFKSLCDEKEAVMHLFRVACGLEAQVLGDMQIPNQIKTAYQLAADADVVGPFLHRLLHTIFFTHKRIHQETSFRDGAASVSYAAVELMEEVTGGNPNLNIAVVGIGEIGLDVVRHLADNEFTNVNIYNRTIEKASEISKETNYNAYSLSELKKDLDNIDVIISSIRTADPYFDKEYLSNTNNQKHKYFIDLSVPRSVDNNVEEVPGFLLYNIDDIKAKSDKALEKRQQSIPAVEGIIGETLVEFGEWKKEMEVSPTINKLKAALEQIRQEEMSKFVKQMDNSHKQMVDKVTKSMMQKIIKLPVLQLKAACKRGEAETLIDVLNDLFNLEKENTPA